MIEGESRGVEHKEGEPSGREIDFHLLRHAEAAGEGIDVPLSETGQVQAQEAAQALLQEVVAKGGGAIKFMASPVRRARETAEIMQQTIEAALAEQKISNVRLMLLRQREALHSAGVIGPLKAQGIEDPVEYWLSHPESVAGANPEAVAERLRGVINHLQALSDRLPPGERIHYVGVTHEVPQAALLNNLSGKTLNELGGRIKNCEPIEINFQGDSDSGPELVFRDFRMSLEAGNEEAGQLPA